MKIRIKYFDNAKKLEMIDKVIGVIYMLIKIYLYQ